MIVERHDGIVRLVPAVGYGERAYMGYVIVCDHGKETIQGVIRIVGCVQT